jgi:hypothetical protein
MFFFPFFGLFKVSVSTAHVFHEMRRRMKVKWDGTGYDLLVGTNRTFSHSNRNATKIVE